MAELFGIDLRSLAAFRISLAGVTLIDWTIRFTDLTPFYTDAGVLSRSLLLKGLYNPWMISLHLISGTTFIQRLLFFAHGACIMALLVGWRTRWATALSWFMTISLQRRNPMILGGGDDYLRLMLFWSLFVPLGARFSVDSLRDPCPISKSRTRMVSFGTSALLLQSAAVYWIAAIQKWPGVPWHDGSAVYYALSIDSYASTVGQSLLLFPAFLKLLTHAVLWAEMIGPLLLFSPFWTAPLRTLAALGFIFMHINFYMSMGLKLFPSVSATAMLTFVPSIFWDRWLPALKLHFPLGVSTRWKTLSRMWGPHFRQSLRQENAGAHRCVRTVRESSLVRLCVIAFFLITAWRCSSTLMKGKGRVPSWVNHIGAIVYTDQAWKLFAPEPLMTSGWYVIAGHLKNGSDVDLLEKGRPLSWAKPTSISSTFPNERWRKFLVNLGDNQYPRLWSGYENYLCRSWNSEHPEADRLESVDMVYLSKVARPSDPITVYRKKILRSYNCERAQQSVQGRSH